MADIREIADFSAPELDIFARLRDSQLANWECAEQGVFIAESKRQKKTLSPDAPFQTAVAANSAAMWKIRPSPCWSGARRCRFSRQRSRCWPK